MIRPTSKHEPENLREHRMGGTQAHYKFPNGWGASVVRFVLPSFTGRGRAFGSYTSDDSEWEVAVLDPSGSISYDSGITDDVIGHVKDGAELDALLDRIAALQSKPTGVK